MIKLHIQCKYLYYLRISFLLINQHFSIFELLLLYLFLKSLRILKNFQIVNHIQLNLYLFWVIIFLYKLKRSLYILYLYIIIKFISNFREQIFFLIILKFFKEILQKKHNIYFKFTRLLTFFKEMTQIQKFIKFLFNFS